MIHPYHPKWKFFHSTHELVSFYKFTKKTKKAIHPKIEKITLAKPLYTHLPRRQVFGSYFIII